VSVEPSYPCLVAAIYREHREELLRYVRREASRRGIPDSKLDSEGVVHETYVAVLHYWKTVRNPRAWLYAVAGRMVGRAVAESRHHAAADPDRAADFGAARWTSLAPTVSVEDAAEARAVLRGLGDLPGKQGIVTYLRHVEGWSHAEIADHLGIEPGASRIHLFRATQRLRAHWPAVLGSPPRTRWHGRPLRRRHGVLAAGIAMGILLMILMLVWLS